MSLNLMSIVAKPNYIIETITQVTNKNIWDIDVINSAFYTHIVTIKISFGG